MIGPVPTPRRNSPQAADKAGEPRSDPPRPPDAGRDCLRVVGARAHNLKNVSLDLPKNRLICLTGVSGSGKSSLAFDTLYAEGQRRYVESLSSYARQFLGELPKPDVDQISGLAPSISIQQKTSGWNPRSTIGTITQIHDYLRVLYARAGDAYCPRCNQPITAQTREQMLGQVLAIGEGVPILVLAPKARLQKGEHLDLFDDLLRRGFVRARVDGEICELTRPPALDRNRRHEIEVVIDRLTIRADQRSRLAEALDLALQEGGQTAMIMAAAEASATNQRKSPNPGPAKEADLPADAEKPAAAARGDLLLSAGYACTRCEVSFEPPSPQLFSFNSPQGMCPNCDGLGTRFDFDPDLLVPDPSKSFLDPCIAALRHKPGRWPRHIYAGVAGHVGFDLETPWKMLPPKARHALLYGTGDAHISFEWRSRQGVWMHGGTFEGVIADLHARYKRATSAIVREFYERFMRQARCTHCNGARLKPQALAVRLTSRVADGGAPAVQCNIHEVCELSLEAAIGFFQNIQLQGVRALIAQEPLKEILARLGFLLEVGLGYLTLSRAAPTLSGGESQRIRLASQIGSGLVGVLYVLDEPSIGLHPRDNHRLLRSLQRLRDMGNTVLVVEHDRDTMEAADFLVDFGPGAGVRGGSITASGTLADLAANPGSVTGAYLSGRAEIAVPTSRRPITSEVPPSEASAAAQKSGKRRTSDTRR